MAQILLVGALGAAFGSAAADEVTFAIAALAVALVAGLAAVGRE